MNGVLNTDGAHGKRISTTRDDKKYLELCEHIIPRISLVRRAYEDEHQVHSIG